MERKKSPTNSKKRPPDSASKSTLTAERTIYLSKYPLDYMVTLFAYNYAEEIIERERGGKDVNKFFKVVGSVTVWLKGRTLEEAKQQGRLLWAANPAHGHELFVRADIDKKKFHFVDQRPKRLQDRDLVSWRLVFHFEDLTKLIKKHGIAINRQPERRRIGRRR